jgi:hypothetical protein
MNTLPTPIESTVSKTTNLFQFVTERFTFNYCSVQHSVPFNLTSLKLVSSIKLINFMELSSS